MWRRHELRGHRRIIRNHVRQHEGDGPAVRDAEARAEGMSQRVTHAHRSVGKRQRRNAGGIVHHGACLFIVRVLISDGEVFEDQSNRLHGVGVGVG